MSHHHMHMMHRIKELLETKMAADKESADRAAAAHMQLAVAHAANADMEGQTALCDKVCVGLRV